MAEAPLPFTMRDLSEEEAARRRARGLVNENLIMMVRVEPGGVLLPPRYRGLAHRFYTFQFRGDDTLLMTYPKCGTHWGMEVLWALRNTRRLHLAAHAHIHERVYLLDRDFLRLIQLGDRSQLGQRFAQECPGGMAERGMVLQLAAAHQGTPRLLATHLPFALFAPALLDTCKVIYIARNPKDVCLSIYNFYCLTGNMTGELRDLADLFMTGCLLPGPYWGHLQQALERRGHPNLHIIFYEDMKADLPKELRRLRDFLQVDASDEELASVAEHTSLENMRAREKTHPMLPYAKEGSFFHGGRVGGWADTAPQDLNATMDRWIKEESSHLDISFRYT